MHEICIEVVTGLCDDTTVSVEYSMKKLTCNCYDNLAVVYGI